MLYIKVTASSLDNLQQNSIHYCIPSYVSNPTPLGYLLLENEDDGQGRTSTKHPKSLGRIVTVETFTFTLLVLLVLRWRDGGSSGGGGQADGPCAICHPVHRNVIPGRAKREPGDDDGILNAMMTLCACFARRNKKNSENQKYSIQTSPSLLCMGLFSRFSWSGGKSRAGGTSPGMTVVE